jgi:DNA-binding response OmpR family regulator
MAMLALSFLTSATTSHLKKQSNALAENRKNWQRQTKKKCGQISCGLSPMIYVRPLPVLSEPLLLIWIMPVRLPTRKNALVQNICDDASLTPIEYKIVSFLARNSGKVMTYSSIMNNGMGSLCRIR